MLVHVITFVIALSVHLKLLEACSNIIVTKRASADESNIVAYNADSATLYGSLYHYPAARHGKGDKKSIYDWDSGIYLGEIAEAEHTFNVVGNTNEKGLIIGETTYGGIEDLQSQPKAKMDYGSLIWTTLQRAATARDAIHTLGNLMEQYGYASEGESFSIADQKEAWVMEIIGKGEFELGAVWVAVRIPDGAVTAHANQARIQKFPLNDPDNAIYAKDVVTFAQSIGIYPRDARPEDFSFSDIYDPVTFSGARFCEARVWSFFSQIMGPEWEEQYLDYAQGYNLTNRMPLYVTPQVGGKISVGKVMDYMRNHYEGTDLDMTGEQFPDVGAQSTHNPQRMHPLTWTSNINPISGNESEDGTSYTFLHERPIGTPQTGWNFVAQSRMSMPAPLASILWFGVDDSSTTVHFPIYGGATKVPEYFAGKGTQDGVTPPMMQFSLKSAFYVFNLVANFVYPRWNAAYPDVKKAIVDIENKYFQDVINVDSTALKMIDNNGGDLTAAVQYATDFSVDTGNKLVEDWTAFFGQLFVKYRDGYVITPDSANQGCGCSVAQPGYDQQWRDRIVTDTRAHYWYAEGESVGASRKSARKPIDKLNLLKRR